MVNFIDCIKLCYLILKTLLPEFPNLEQILDSPYYEVVGAIAHFALFVFSFYHFRPKRLMIRKIPLSAKDLSLTNTKSKQRKRRVATLLNTTVTKAPHGGKGI